MKIKIFKKILGISAVTLIVLCFFSALYNTTTADTTYTLLEPLIVPGDAPIKETANIGVYLEGIFKLGIGIASVLAVLMITIGGLQYMTSDKVQLITDAKTTIISALWGLVLVLASFLLLQTINPNLVNFNLNLKPVLFVAPAPGQSAWKGGCSMFISDSTGTYYLNGKAHGNSQQECSKCCQDLCVETLNCESATDTCTEQKQ